MPEFVDTALKEIDDRLRVLPVGATEISARHDLKSTTAIAQSSVRCLRARLLLRELVGPVAAATGDIELALEMAPAL